MSVIFDATKLGVVKIRLRKGGKVVADTHLTVGQDFDIVLITALDKLIRSNKIERLSLKNVKIRGKMRPGAISGMTLKTVAEALNN